MTQVTAEMIERGRRGDAVTRARRRKMAARLRETRVSLSSKHGNHFVFSRELGRSFALARKNGVPALIMLTLLIALVATLWLRVGEVLIWLALMTATLALNYACAMIYLNQKDANFDPNPWRKRFILIEALQGCVWAVLMVLVMHAHDETVNTFVLFTVLLVAAVSTLLSSHIPESVYASIVPMTLAVVMVTQFPPNAKNLPLTVMAISAQVYFVIMARRLYSSTLTSLAHGMEKEELIAELEESKFNSDEARRRAEEASLAKSRFLATMSHELRTPLNAILGFSEVMKAELFGPHSVAAYKDYANDIHSSGEHLLMLINEILDLSRVEAGRYELKEEAVSLAAVVEDCIHLLRMRAQNREITMNEHIETNMPRLWADERALRQIILNLLNNAIKFTPQGGSITIKAGGTIHGGEFVSIRDTGPGIPADEIPIVLSSFGRGSMAQKNADEGSGLGLPIVKGLVEMHGGTFTLTSEVRVGTEVLVILPPERVMNALPQINPGELMMETYEDYIPYSQRRDPRRAA